MNTATIENFWVGMSWDVRAIDVYAAAMHCKTTPIDKWDRDRLDCFPNAATEFCDIVTPEVLRELDSETIREMAEGYAATL